jgi:hypothetical protein
MNIDSLFHLHTYFFLWHLINYLKVGTNQFSPLMAEISKVALNNIEQFRMCILTKR